MLKSSLFDRLAVYRQFVFSGICSGKLKPQPRSFRISTCSDVDEGRDRKIELKLLDCKLFEFDKHILTSHALFARTFTIEGHSIFKGALSNSSAFL